jgi:hypothetical protein
VVTKIKAIMEKKKKVKRSGWKRGDYFRQGDQGGLHGGGDIKAEVAM